MRTGNSDSDPRPMHPEDLLREFRARIATYDALGYTAVDCYFMMETHGTICEVPVSKTVAGGLRELFEDYQDLERGILAWVESNRLQQ